MTVSDLSERRKLKALRGPTRSTYEASSAPESDTIALYHGNGPIDPNVLQLKPRGGPQSVPAA